MAEIKIEKKSPVWLWVLIGLIILALLIWLLTRNTDADEAVTAADTTQNVVDTTGANAAGTGDGVQNYVDYLNSGESMGLNHEFTNGALIRLANAIEAKANQVGYNVEADLARVREAADEITRDTEATTHANKISNSANTMAAVMTNMQQAKFSNLSNEAQEVNNAANSIKPDQLTLDQKDAIKSFFDKSADLLQKMN